MTKAYLSYHFHSGMCLYPYFNTNLDNRKKNNAKNKYNIHTINAVHKTAQTILLTPSSGRYMLGETTGN